MSGQSTIAGGIRAPPLLSLRSKSSRDPFNPQSTREGTRAEGNHRRVEVRDLLSLFSGLLPVATRPNLPTDDPDCSQLGTRAATPRGTSNLEPPASNSVPRELQIKRASIEI